MTEANRRSFLQLLGAGTVAGVVPPNIARALEIPADRRTGTIDDVQHIVILTQENRSFDHYFGTLQRPACIEAAFWQNGLAPAQRHV
jgi:phospholipase C